MANNLNITHHKTKPLNVDVNFNPFNLDFSKIPIHQNTNQYEEMDYTDILKEDKFTFDDLTDRQYSSLALVTYEFIPNIDKFKVGMKLSQVSNLISEIRNQTTVSNDEVNKLPSDFISFTNMTIVEVYKGKDGYNCLVVQDEVGNYMLLNPCTADPDHVGEYAIYDICYNFYPILVEIGAYETSWLTNMESKELLNLIGNIFGVDMLKAASFLGDQPLEKIKEIYFSQREQAEKLSKKYYNIAKDENVELSFLGYSKSGSLSEYSYLRCAENDGSENVLGDIILYNPLHEHKLSEEEVKILQEADMKLYRQQGDFVSAIYQEHTFEENTIYIKCNWKKLYGDLKDPNAGLIYAAAKILFSQDNDVDVLKNIENLGLAVRGGPHSIGFFDSGAFNDDGSAVAVESYDYEDVSKEIFGVEDILKEGEEFLDKSTFTPTVLGTIVRTGDYFTHKPVGNSKSMGEIIYDYGSEFGKDQLNHFKSIIDDNIDSFSEAIPDPLNFAENITMSTISTLIDNIFDTGEFVIDMLSNMYETISDAFE